MVAARRDIDALGRSGEDRRLLLDRHLADCYAARAGVPVVAADGTWTECRCRPLHAASHLVWMALLATRASIFERRALARQPVVDPACTCEDDDQACVLHSLECECATPAGCLDSCVCWGRERRSTFTAPLDCRCTEFEVEDEERAAHAPMSWVGR